MNYDIEDNRLVEGRFVRCRFKDQSEIHFNAEGKITRIFDRVSRCEVREAKRSNVWLFEKVCQFVGDYAAVGELFEERVQGKWDTADEPCKFLRGKTALTQQYKAFEEDLSNSSSSLESFNVILGDAKAHIRSIFVGEVALFCVVKTRIECHEKLSFNSEKRVVEIEREDTYAVL